MAQSQRQMDAPKVSLLEQYWEKHPFLFAGIQLVREGEWVSHVFEWLFMMVSRFAGYLMTLAVGYLIFYAIETKHSLDAIPAHPQLTDQIAIYSNIIINVAPELVFPGVVVLCIRAFTVRRWLDAALYVVTTIAFVILTMVLLNAFMNNSITKDFLATMLFWRAGAALFYTVVVAYCGGHGGLDFKGLLKELDTLRVQLDGGQQQLSSVQQRASTLQQQLDTGQREVSRLQSELATDQQRGNRLQVALETEQQEGARLKHELSVALADADGLRAQLEGKHREIGSLRESLENGQEWQGTRVSSLQQQLDNEQAMATGLRRQLNAALADVDGLRQEVFSLRQKVDGIGVSTGQAKVSTGRGKLNTGQEREVSSGQGKVVQLDTSRRKSGQGESAEVAEHIRALLIAEPGLSGRGIASKIGCSPTTAAKWKQFFENGGQTSTEECVNE